MDKKEIQNHCRNYLPHIENQRYQMITYRLYDSVPRQVIEQWKQEMMIGVQAARLPQQANGTQAAHLLQQVDGMQAAHLLQQANGMQAAHLLQQADEPSALQLQLQHKLLVQIDKYEDSGCGQCFMKDGRVAKIVFDNLMFHNGKKYNLLKWCIMPNHVHVLIEVFRGISLSEILHSWRSFTAHQINKLLNRIGQVWMMEYFDRYIRDSDHYEKVVNYIHNNPVKAGLVSSPTEYRWSSAFVELK
jgi:REP element-mobilizing transposase RayT